MTLAEAVETIRNYCSKTGCKDCVFVKKHNTDVGFWGCKLDELPCEWKMPPETNIYDEEEIHKNCTVQILKNSVTEETSIGWWEND